MFKRIVYCYDNDAVGLKAAMEIRSKLINYQTVSLLRTPDINECKDVCDIYTVTKRNPKVKEYAITYYQTS